MPFFKEIMLNAAIAGAYTAKKKSGCCPVMFPTRLLVCSGKKIKKAKIPQEIANVMSKNGKMNIVGI